MVNRLFKLIIDVGIWQAIKPLYSQLIPTLTMRKNVLLCAHS
jgi:hypothetical protein